MQRRPAVLSFLVVAILVSAQLVSAQAQTPLNFENNFFVTGDYVVAGWYGKHVSASHAGYASGTIQFPDPVQAKYVQAGVPTTVPAGADIVGAWIYWTTVEKSQSANAGQTAYLGVNGHPTYTIQGAPLDQSAPVSWSSGGCAGNANGTTTMRVYRANVRPLLPVDANGLIQPNTSYTLEFADSGSNGNTAPFTLGATMVIIYRALSPNVPLSAVVIYDGAFAPSNSNSTFGPQTLQGFYQPAASRIAKITHIVGNGQTKKGETVSLNGHPLSSLYGKNIPPFPGLYNNSGNTLPQAWDNPTWIVSNTGGNFDLLNAAPGDNTATTSVVPSSNNSGCVSWGAVIFSTTVQDSDGDGLLDYWEQSPTGPNPPPAAINPGVGPANPNGDPGYIDVGSGRFIALPNANPNQKDIFIQLDSMCSGSIVTDTTDYSSTCDTGAGGTSFAPPPDALTMMSGAFAAKSITVHYDPKPHAIPSATCTDSSNQSPCSYPDQPGVVTWKDGFTFFKNQPLNYANESDCETLTVNGVAGTGPACIRRFDSGRKDSYHYVIAANALGAMNWSMGSTLSRVVVGSDGVATFTTTSPPAFDASNNHTGLIANEAVLGNGRISVAGAIQAPTLNGVWFITSASNAPTIVNGVATYTFTAQTAGVPAGTYDISSDPNLGVASGQGGTGSGYSDGGGADSLVTLGLWGPDGQPSTVQAGTFMHELGHTLALFHGGAYPDTAGSFALTFEPNCKPNYQSIMNYMFQVDLLDGSSLDYSEQGLNGLNENSLPAGLTTTDNSALAFLTTKWYLPDAPNGVGTAALRRCDGTLILPTDPDQTMFLAEGGANPIAPVWVNGSDVNFTGAINAQLRGYNDWLNLDLRQIGATGTLSTAGSGFGSTGGSGFGTTGGSGFGSTGGSGFGSVGGSGFGSTGGSGFGSVGGSGFGSVGGSGFGTTGGTGELTREGANSYVRPPQNGSLTVSPNDTRLAHSATLTWKAPSFGQIAWYNVYRAQDGAAATLFFPATDGTQGASGTSYTDSNVTPCHTYTYFVTSVLLDNTVASGFRESVFSTSATYVDPCPPLNASSPANASTQVPLSWGPPSGPMASDVAAYNVYRATGQNVTDPSAFALLASNVSGTSYTDTGTGAFAFTNNTYYSYVVTALYPDGCTGNQLCRESVDSNTTTTFIHFTVNPNVTWPSASAITFGQTLASSKLTGGSASDPSTGNPVDGSFVFVDPTIAPPVGNGSYLASVKFVPTDTYDYNVVIGSVFVPVNKAATTTTITSISANPNPPLLGQTITVNFSVSPSGASGSVTVTEDSGASCTGNLVNGSGSCQLTLNVLTSSLKSAVGRRLLSGVYSGDGNYAQSQTSSGFPVQVVYRFTGFLSPLNGTGTYAGALNLGKAVPLKWQLTNVSGTTFITMSNLNLNGSGQVNVLLQAFYNGPAQNNGKCGPPSFTTSGGTAPISLFSPAFGVTGNSNFRYDNTNNQFIFNWDTTVNLGAGCYTVALWLDDAVPQLPQAGLSTPVWATSLQLK